MPKYLHIQILNLYQKEYRALFLLGFCSCCRKKDKGLEPDVIEMDSFVEEQNKLIENADILEARKMN